MNTETLQSQTFWEEQLLWQEEWRNDVMLDSCMSITGRIGMLRWPPMDTVPLMLLKGEHLEATDESLKLKQRVVWEWKQKERKGGRQEEGWKKRGREEEARENFPYDQTSQFLRTFCEHTKCYLIGNQIWRFQNAATKINLKKQFILGLL